MQKILFIEDDIAVRENTAEIIELANYEVFTAPNGKIGVTMAKEILPDLILCDIMMPELDGYGVIKELSNFINTKNIPFIFLSAKTEHKDIRKGMDMGADDYLTKPFEESDLLNAIESRLAKASILKEHFNQSNTFIELNQIHNLNDLKNYMDDFGNIHKFKKGEEIYKQGNHSNFIYLITKGVVKCHKIDDSGKELTVDLYNEDELLGYVSILQNEPYQETATAIENCVLISIPKEKLNQILNKNYKITFELINLLSDHLNSIKDQLLQMAYGSVRKKTATTILLFADKMNKNLHDNLKISRNDLASVAGIATESLIRTLSSFTKEGLIEIEGRNIKILQLDKLKKVI